MGTVRINAEKIKADIKRMGLSTSQVSRSLGKSDSYVHQMLRHDFVREETVHALEKALYQPEGSYVLKDAEARESKPTAVQEGNLASVLGSLSERLNNIEDAIPEDKSDILFERIQNLEGVMRQTNTWLARLYAVWTNREEQSAQG